MADEVIIKLHLNKILYKLLHNQQLVDKWWESPNRAFGDMTPEDVYQSGPEGRKKVKDYLMFHQDYQT